MKNALIAFYFILVICGELGAQTFTNSNLPIVIITTDGNKTIPDDPKILGSMKIINRGSGQRNYVTDQSNNAVLDYNGKIKIEIRGSSSQSLNKKQYSFTTLLNDNVTNNNVKLLGMPKENDWVLNGLAFDPSFIRDHISYNLSRKIGEYAPRTVYCEVMINGDYRGLYMLQEKIKADDNRVDISKIEPDDNSLPDLSGGYITKADKVSGDDVSAWKMESYILSSTVDFIHEFPKPSDVTTQQNDYIKSQFEKLAVTSKAGNISFSSGYPSVIDVPSFIDFMIVNELAANVDAYQFSTYFHKDKNGKLRAGPLWDLNLTYGNDLFRWGYDRSKKNTWQFNNGDNIGPRFWKDLFNDDKYKCYLAKRWNELTASGEALHLTSINSLIDETVVKLAEAIPRNDQRWPEEASSSGHPTEIDSLKKFLEKRIIWINSNIGSAASCSNVETPPLVITKIMYHASVTSEFPDGNDQEFIEITNNSNEAVDLTGVYFGGTGFVYQFPVGSVLPAQGILQLTSHRDTFVQQHGFSAFGEFTRSLNSDGQKIALLDGFGNVIDLVEYADEAPWPDANANGKYIQLKDVDLDNNIGTNWIASSDPVFSTITANEESNSIELQIYPNPVENSVRINSNSSITALHLRDIQGRLLKTIDADRNSVDFNMTNYTSGVYLLHVQTQGKSVVRKIMKK